MSKLTFRLQKIAELVNKKNICDVGCDHGKLAYYLLNNNKVSSVVVSDISAPSLQKAIDLLSKNNYKFEAICCDGLTGYKRQNIEQCIISGMGGDEIIKIISSSPINIDSYILSPQHNIIAVKKFVLSEGYDIDYDIIIEDKGKFYNIFRCNKTKNVSEYDDVDLLIGRANFNDKDSSASKFVDHEINKIDRILNGNNEVSQDLLDYYKTLKKYKKRN